MPSLSIVIPVYEAEAYLAGCLGTIVGGGDRLEVIVVDDCSPDGSRAVAERFAAEDPRIRVVSTPQNAGSGPARNFGLTQAAGDYVWFVDGDDELKPGAVERVLAANGRKVGHLGQRQINRIERHRRHRGVRRALNRRHLVDWQDLHD